MNTIPASRTTETHVPVTNITPGSSLYPAINPTHWSSSSGQFAFGFYKQGSGYAVGIWLVGAGAGAKNNTVVWTANRDDPLVTSNASLQLTAQGKLVVQIEQGKEKIIADATASSASMLDSGNFVLYNQTNGVIWQSFDYPTDTMLGGQSLPCGAELLSSSSDTNHSSGRFRLKMQDDGKFGLYPAFTTNTTRDAYWPSDSDSPSYDDKILQGKGKAHLYLNNTGLLVSKNDSNSVIWSYYGASSMDSIGNNHIIYRATLDPDGVLRVYGHDKGGEFKKVSQWPLYNGCEVKGYCGFNSYCTFNDDKPYCYCLEGFEFVEADEPTLGCKRNFSIAECSGAAYYNMVTMLDIQWEDHSYFGGEMKHEEQCSDSCLHDCNCWGALYENGYCVKQGIPFRYVSRRVEGFSANTMFLKVGNITHENKNPNDITNTIPLSIRSTSNKAVVTIIVITSVFTLLLCSMIAISCHLIYKIRVLRLQRQMETGNLGLNEEVALGRFCYSELKRATNGFKQELGKGSFGAVYKGSLYKSRRSIAVKRLEKLVEEGEREFQAEVRAIGKTHHRNLVRLLGFCAEGPKRLLVYEYMSNGSLGKLLFGNERHPHWDERVRIALDIARGILYLHEECEAPIIHCDIKPQNILMDEFWTAKISDFGLAKLLMPDQTRTFTGVRGTRGYVAPEWQKNIPISVKADVYSYGVVLLEVICCRRNLEVSVSVPEEILLSGWTYKCFVAKELHKLVHWEIVDKNVLENMVKVALWCIQEEPALRPTMKSVVLMLEGVTDVAIPPCPTTSISM
ncbi:hypothetical protein PIB30_019431 [Stylosanthes scabra]|uniref:Receptor-like serine/threonine-protein kinase n=1 Tax=Stylosanthes scabra TaxID=79078 RepID=A0ABU6R8I7_9FABA|nr:hypothetical protein [Stylosanthes scabra]